MNYRFNKRYIKNNEIEEKIKSLSDKDKNEIKNKILEVLKK